MSTNYVLIDYENVQVKSLGLLKGEHIRVPVFLGPKNLKLHRELVFAMHLESAENISCSKLAARTRSIFTSPTTLAC